jgi:hypothetical protein
MTYSVPKCICEWFYEICLESWRILEMKMTLMYVGYRCICAQHLLQSTGTGFSQIIPDLQPGGERSDMPLTKEGRTNVCRQRCKRGSPQCTRSNPSKYCWVGGTETSQQKRRNPAGSLPGCSRIQVFALPKEGHSDERDGMP